MKKLAEKGNRVQRIKLAQHIPKTQCTFSIQYMKNNIVSLLKALGVNTSYNIPDASSLFFELHEDEISRKDFIKVYIDNNELDISNKERKGDMKIYKPFAQVYDDKNFKNNETHLSGNHQFKLPSSELKDLGDNKYDEPDDDSLRYDYFKRSMTSKIIAQSIPSF